MQMEFTEDEIQRMMAEAEAARDGDLKKRELADVRGNAEGLIYTTERSLAESANYLTESELAQIRVDLEEGRRATESADMTRMANALRELEKSAFRITEVMYKDLA